MRARYVVDRGARYLLLASALVSIVIVFLVFYFTIRDTLHSAAPESAGYQPVIPSVREPYLSPDGSMILYLQPVGTVGAYDVWVANADGSNPHNVTNVPGTYKECARWGGF